MEVKGLYSAMKQAYSGMSSQTKRMALVSENIANADRVAKPGEDVYKRKSLINDIRSLRYRPGNFNSNLRMRKGNSRHLSANQFQEKRFGKLSGHMNVREENKEKMIFEPDHPYADDNGYVRSPDINIVEEMVELMSLSRTYEANLSAFNTVKTMSKKALEI